LDNLNDYYDVSLKKSRLGNLLKYPTFDFHQIDLTNKSELEGFLNKGSLTMS